jgi:uncharacterized protein DUF5719
VTAHGGGRRRAPAPANGEAAATAGTGLLRLVPESGTVRSGVVVAILVFAAVIVALAGHGAPPVRAVTDDVRTADLVCPGAADRLAGARTTLSVAAMPPRFTTGPTPGPAADTTVHGSATITDLTPAAAVREQLGSIGTARVDVTKITAPATVVRGKDDLAPGLAAELVTETGLAGGGLSALPCTPPAISHWFIGASTAVGRRDRLVLMNPEVTPASVDLHLWDANGAVDAPNSTAIAVPAAGVVSIALDGMAPGHQSLAVEVTATAGQVAAALHDLDTTGTTVNGDDWIEPSVAPNRYLVIPGLPDGTSSRKLYLAAPEGGDAIVKVRLLTADNDFAPAGADTITVPGGKVGEYDLTASDGAAAAVITADRPVIASARSARTAPGASDIAWASAVAPLSASAVVADGRGATVGATALLLSAPTSEAVVSVTVFTGSGVPRTTVAHVPAGRLVSLDPSGGASQFTVVVTPQPGSGPVYGARVLRLDAGGLTVTSLLGGRVSVVIPAVVPDVTAATAEAEPTSD